MLHISAFKPLATPSDFLCKSISVIAFFLIEERVLILYENDIPQSIEPRIPLTCPSAMKVLHKYDFISIA